MPSKTVDIWRAELVLVKSSYSGIKAGLFLVVLVWFSYTMCQLGMGIINGVAVPFTDMPSLVGMGFRAAGGFVALVTISFYLVKRDLSIPEVVTSARWVLLLEAAYWASLFPSAVWGFQFESTTYSRLLIIVETALPCLLESTLMPFMFGVLFFKLSLGKSVAEAIKWMKVTGAVTILVFWFNYSMQWLSDVILKGVGFLVLHPLNAFGFILTAGGLLALALYAMASAGRSSGAKTLETLDFKKAGFVVTAFGLYFSITYLLWLLFGSPIGSIVWRTFFFGHNLDLWMLSLPIVGLPLVFNSTAKG